MRKLDRYITRTVGGATLLVMLVVLSLDVIFGFIAELDDARADYQAFDALLYVLMTLPRRIYDYLPVGAFMGCLVGLGALASSSELVVVRAAGVSLRRIVVSAMKPTLIVIVFGLLLGEYVAPHFERIAQSQKAVALGAGENVAAATGFWHREGNTFMHMNAVQPNGVLHGVSLFRFDDERWLESATFAKRAIHQGDHWILGKGTRTRLTREGAERETFRQERWETDLSPEVLSVLIVKPDNLSISGLYTYATYLEAQGLSAGNYWLSFWKKVLAPVAIAVLVLVAISFVFGPLRSVTMGFRVFTGIIVGLLFKYMQDLLGPMSLVFGFDPILAITAPILVSGLVGAYLMKKAG
ncbi:lipopolysaccharide export system permease protein [Tamilnaduibacter salinus]|uniref:LPS export ABC transporter permease LptG n=1 Tax=Tamilnaduibacter salinus TaxID=1484056 RepID=A0A2A2I060_9GAMM|nr:LPS export ABC transporter permease LptG [Tamilnaduibacter salinus]PAV24535.1 LPS export ABC transporter permease LptG [Tamilnaduibacter salinus]PVY69591.1 lipopolysaccharide export system permease protein [Tamilnaduibacter salinus]